MRPAQAWKLLGVDASADRREVRRAYAALLKQIDPDRDVEGFLKLREALETAENEIRWRSARQAAALAEADDEQAGAEAAAEVQTVPAAPQAPDPQPPAETPQRTQRPQIEPQLERTVPPEPPGAADPFADQRRRFAAAVTGQSGDPTQAVALFRQLLTDPQLISIDARERFESWLAELLYEAGPAADAVIPLATEQFGWANELSAINPRWLQQQVAQRADDLAALARLEKPGHHWHEAYLTLLQPAPEGLGVIRRIALGQKVLALLASLRRHNPAIEGHFDPAHVALWESSVGVGGGASTALFRDRITPFGWYVLIYLVIQAIAWAVPL